MHISWFIRSSSSSSLSLLHSSSSCPYRSLCCSPQAKKNCAVVGRRRRWNRTNVRCDQKIWPLSVFLFSLSFALIVSAITSYDRACFFFFSYRSELFFSDICSFIQKWTPNKTNTLIQMVIQLSLMMNINHIQME